MGELAKFLNEVANKYTVFWQDRVCDIPKISIIVPAYNVEKYIEDCLGSLVKQTFKDFEVIVVNDGSSDMTAEIANVFQACDKRFKLISQKNKGISSARNVGIKSAKGEYITFLDSDDWVSENYLESLYGSIVKNDCDIAVSSIVRKRSNFQKYRVYYIKEKVYETLKEKIDICNIPNCCYVWNKLYKADLVKNREFEEGKYFEDVLWMPEVIKASDRLVTVPDVRYYYRVVKNSIVKTISKKKQDNSYNAKKYIIKFFDENNLVLSKKQRTITKEIRYFLGIPWLRIKEFENDEVYYLFNLVPVLKKEIKKIFLVFNTACFGDVLLCNSLCQNIKNIYPQSKIVFITDKPYSDVAKYQKDVDDVVVYDKKEEHKGIKGFFVFIENFKYKNVYASFVTYKNFRNCILSYFLGCKHIVTPKKGENNISVQEKHNFLLKQITKQQIFNFPIRYIANKVMPSKFAEILPKNKKYIGFCLLTKNPPKDMPLNTAIELIKLINKKGEYNVVFLGVGDKNMKYANNLRSEGCRFIDLINKTSIYELAQIIKKLDGVISCDTGTMHLSYALDVPTLALFYEKENVKTWGPDSKLYKTKVVAENLTAENIENAFYNLMKEYGV